MKQNQGRHVVRFLYILVGCSFWQQGLCESAYESAPPAGFNKTLSVPQARFCIFESVRVQYIQTIAKYSTVYNPIELQKFVSAKDKERRELCALGLLSDRVEAAIVAELKGVRPSLRTQALRQLSDAVDPNANR